MRRLRLEHGRPRWIVGHYPNHERPFVAPNAHYATSGTGERGERRRPNRYRGSAPRAPRARPAPRTGRRGARPTTSSTPGGSVPLVHSVRVYLPDAGAVVQGGTLTIRLRPPFVPSPVQQPHD